MTRRIARFDNPARGLAATTAKEFQPPSRPADAWGRERSGRHRRRRSPAGRWQRCRSLLPRPAHRATQHEGGDAGILGGKLQPPARRQVELCDLAYRGGEAGMTQRLLQSPENLGIRGRLSDEHATRLKPDGGEAGGVKVGNTPAPEHRPAEASEQARDEQRRRRAEAAVSAAADNLVQRAAGEAAQWQSSIDRGHVEGQYGTRIPYSRAAAPLQALDARPQRLDYFMLPCLAHAARSESQKMFYFRSNRYQSVNAAAKSVARQQLAISGSGARCSDFIGASPQGAPSSRGVECRGDPVWIASPALNDGETLFEKSPARNKRWNRYTRGPAEMLKSFRPAFFTRARRQHQAAGAGRRENAACKRRASSPDAYPVSHKGHYVI